MTSDRPPLDHMKIDIAISIHERRNRKKISKHVSRELSTISSDSVILVSAKGDLIGRIALSEIEENINSLYGATDRSQTKEDSAIPKVIEIDISSVDKIAQQQLIHDHFPVNWCQENLVVPINVAPSSGGTTLTVGLCNPAYIKTVDGILRQRLVDKFFDIQYVIVDFEYPLNIIDEFRASGRFNQSRNNQNQSSGDLEPKPEVMDTRSGKSVVGTQSQNHATSTNPEYINIDQILPKNTQARMMLAGAGTAILGLFMPALKVPVLGSITYLHDGRGDGILVLIGMIIACIFMLNNKPSAARYASCVCLLVQFATISAFYAKKSAIQNDLDSSLSGNPFRGIADAAFAGMSLEWAWLFLIGGTIWIIVSSLLIVDSTVNKLSLPRYSIYPERGSYQYNLLFLLGAPLIAGWLLGIAFGK